MNCTRLANLGKKHIYVNIMTHKNYQISTTDTGRWCCIDLTDGITCTWEDGKFVESQKFSFNGDSNPLNVASLLREMGDWLMANHREKLTKGEIIDVEAETFQSVEANIRDEVGSMIQKMRIAKGYTQSDLGKMCGLSKNHICRIEAGRYNVTIDTLGRILWALDAGIDFYFEEEDDDDDTF